MFRKFFIFCIISLSYSRSPHRPQSRNTPYIIVQDKKSKERYSFRDSHLREGPLFKTYEQKFFNENILPKSIDTKVGLIDGQKLDKKINKLLHSLLKRKNLKNVTILKNKDFNPVTRSGLMVLKFNKYPFVIKLFLENPKSLSHPYHNGFDVRGLFVMGGCLRHLAGFTRVKTAKVIREKCEKNEYWSQKVTIPRKWFWLPEKPEWLEIRGFNIGQIRRQKTRIPKIYGIVADAIEHKATVRPTDKECLKLSTFLDYLIDPHVENFVIESESNKIAIIDTEHFPTMVGINKKIRPTCNYATWYTNLAKHYLKNNFFMFKDDREKRQFNSESDYYLY